MTSLYRHLSATTLAVLCGATAVLQACGADDLQDPARAESKALALSGTNARLDVYQQSLDRFAAAVRAEENGTTCRWRVVQPTFLVAPDGVRLRGSLSANCLAYRRTLLPGAVVKPVAGISVSSPSSGGSTWLPVGTASFDLPVAVTYRDGFLRLDVSSEPIEVVNRYTRQTIYRVDLSPYFGTRLYVAKTPFDTERSTFEAAAENVTVSLLDGRIQVTSHVAIN